MQDEQKDLIRQAAKYEAYPYNKGGQNVAVIPRGVKLSVEDLGIEICIAYGRTQHENRELVNKLFESLLNEL